MFDHDLRHIQEFEPHIFVPSHGGVEVEVFDVHREKICPRG